MAIKHIINATVLLFSCATHAMELQLLQAVAQLNPPCPITVPYIKKTVDTWVNLGIKDLSHPKFNEYMSYAHTAQNYHHDALFFKQYPAQEILYKNMCYKVFSLEDEKPRMLFKEALKKRRAYSCPKDNQYTVKIDTMFAGTAANLKKYTEAKKEYPALDERKLRSDVQIRVTHNDAIEIKTQLVLSTREPQPETFVDWLCSFFAYYEQ